ncbi:MAG: zinc ribbon domain-containing protein [Clostridia bacterium]|nr:zinc ribbon domain-containing protein [Clostridia bacterium]
MAFCYNCGAPLAEDANFCEKCGTRVADNAAAPIMPQAAQTAPAAPISQAAPVPPAAPIPPAPGAFPMPPAPFNFSAIPVRYLCPNGHVTDGNEGMTNCPKCGAPLPRGGYIQIYRMGNYMGMAVGMGIYLNNVPCGHLGNKKSIRLSVPYGAHMLHMTHTATRVCNDPVFNITPEYPYVWCKARFVSAGFQIRIDPASPDSMPQK